jgi:hypothetical protein
LVSKIQNEQVELVALDHRVRLKVIAGDLDIPIINIHSLLTVFTLSSKHPTMSLSLTHEDTDPWRVDPQPSTEPIYPPASPRHRRNTSSVSRKGKERETFPHVGPEEEDGIGARMGTMERLNVLAGVVESSNGRDKVL